MQPRAAPKAQQAKLSFAAVVSAPARWEWVAPPSVATPQGCWYDYSQHGWNDSASEAHAPQAAADAVSSVQKAALQNERGELEALKNFHISRGTDDGRASAAALAVKITDVQHRLTSLGPPQQRRKTLHAALDRQYANQARGEEEAEAIQAQIASLA